MKTFPKTLMTVAMAVLLTACGVAETSAPPSATSTLPPIPTKTDTPLPTNTNTPVPTETTVPVPKETTTPVPTKTITPTPTPTSAPLNIEGSNYEISMMNYGGRYNDWAYDILLLADGGTLIAGQANNTGFSARISPGNARLIRTDSQGGIIWEKDYGGGDDAYFYSPIHIGDDEYVILGQIAASYTRDEMDMYLVKIDGDGNEIWSHTYGGRGMDHSKMVRQTSDGGFILVGSRADEFPTGNQYEADIVIIKTDAEGNEVWTRTYGNKILESAWAVAETPDGGYILAGDQAKTHDDRDVLVIKTNQIGEFEWSRTWDLDPRERDSAYDMIMTSDGYIIIACIQSMNKGPRKAALIKVDLDGNEIWEKVFGEEGMGYEFWDVLEDSDGGYIMSGSTVIQDPSTRKDIRSGLIIKTDPDGEVIWQQTLSPSEYKEFVFSSAVLLPNGGYIFVGATSRRSEKYRDMLWLKLTPEGTLIAFTSERDGNADIYTMNADGRDPRRLTTDPAYDGWPTWSPEGSQIAFMSVRSGNPDIYVMDADGSNLRQLTHHPANDIWPEWEPDGTRIAFPSRRDGNFEIYLINADGTDLQRLTNTPGHEDFPAWSPDGTQIVFSRVEGNDGTYVMNIDDFENGSHNERQLLDFIVLEPAWSPDGSQIAFGSDHEGFRGIYIIDVDGSNLQKLSNTRTGENCPTWSPDGTRIAFASWRDGDGEIYVMDVDGRNLQKLTNNNFDDEFPAWRPMSTETSH